MSCKKRSIQWRNCSEEKIWMIENHLFFRRVSRQPQRSAKKSSIQWGNLLHNAPAQNIKTEFLNFIFAKGGEKEKVKCKA